MPYAPRATFDNPYGPQVTFRTEDVLPPSAYYIAPEDQVMVWLVTDVAGQTIFLQLRMLMPTGEIKLIPYQFNPQSVHTWYAAYELPPWEGYLLGAQICSLVPQRGRTFVSVQIMRGAPPDLQHAGVVLMQGYVSQMSVLSYPTCPIESTFSGRGAFVTLQPAGTAGGFWSATVPPLTLWRLCSLWFAFTASSAGVPRAVGVTVKDANSNSLGFWFADATQPVGTTYDYTFTPGGPTSTLSPTANIGGPTDVYLTAGDSIGSDVLYLDSADSFTTINMRVEEWVGQ